MFSQRKGYKPVSETIQIDSISPQLRNSLWNILSVSVFSINYHVSVDSISRDDSKSRIINICRYILIFYFKIPVDSIPYNFSTYVNHLRDYFFECEWFEVYDFLEILLSFLDSETINIQINIVLERELSGFRYVDGVFTDITSQQEIESLESVLNDDDFPSVREHLYRSLALYSDRDDPDYRNSIKESILAVESISRIITNNPKASLGDALKHIENDITIHPALKSAFIKLYGYTSDENGIRHAMLEDPNLSQSDARFFLVVCSAFINYLKSKI